MKKGISFTLIIVGIALITGVYYLFIYQGEFTLGSFSTVSMEAFDEHEVIYLSHTLQWEGIGSPTLQEVQLVKADGTTPSEQDRHISITPIIAPNHNIGAIDEVTLLDEGIIEELVPVEGYPLQGNYVSLVFRVELIYKDKELQRDFHRYIIHYRHLGVNKKQTIEMEGFITH